MNHQMVFMITVIFLIKLEFFAQHISSRFAEVLLLTSRHLIGGYLWSAPVELFVFLAFPRIRKSLVSMATVKFLLSMVLRNLQHPAKSKTVYSSLLEQKTNRLLQHQKLDLEIYLRSTILSSVYQTIMLAQERLFFLENLPTHPNFNGSGTLRKFTGTAESLTVNPVERQMLFSFAGELGEAFIANPPEEGTEIKFFGEIPTPLLTFAEQPEIQISVSGTAIQRYRPNVIGSGSFEKLSGAAESLTINPEEKQLLFSFTGGITSEKHTEVYVGVDTQSEFAEVLLLTSRHSIGNHLGYHKELSRSVVMLEISGFQTMLDLVISLALVDLLSPSLLTQMKDKCSSRSSERDLTRARLQFLN